MIAEEQDIIMLQNILFKDHNELDLHLNGHPVLIIHKTEDYFYYLTISSNTNKNPRKQGYHYPLKKTKKNRLTTPISYVNLRNIYKAEIKGYLPVGHINNDEYLKIIKQFNDFQRKYKKDEFFNEIIKNDKGMKL